MARPDLLRSWTTDVIGLFDQVYVWHDLAQIWQTPGAGEEAVTAMAAAPPAQRADQLAQLGVTNREVAEQLAAGFDQTMGRCILALYRSAAQPVVAELGRELPVLAKRPGLAILATEDHYVGTDEMRRRCADRANARTEVLDGLGHWWMVQDPARGAEVLNRFWASLPD